MRDMKKILPFSLTACIILADQAVKTFIAENWRLSPSGGGVFIKDVFDNDLVWIVHVRNKAIAFSLGDGLPDAVRPILFIVLPLLVLGAVIWYYVKSHDFTRLQRWAVAGIIGGGLGNIVDRIFRSDGVVDFISVKFFGLFGFDRWPTFNIADASVVICCIILLLSIFLDKRETKSDQKIQKVNIKKEKYLEQET
ncbi:MAG: signal peptidase II [Treponema sp.]|jgi:signal peptidase II|nr:signal peptidase II [Treponema sp.]